MILQCHVAQSERVQDVGRYRVDMSSGGGTQWRVAVRFSQVLQLRRDVRRRGALAAALPPMRKVVLGHASQQCRRRRVHEIQALLETVLEIRQESNNVCVQTCVDDVLEIDRQIHRAAANDDVAFVRHLVHDKGMDPNTRDEAGYTPWQYAAYHESTSVVEYLATVCSADVQEHIHGVVPMHIIRPPHTRRYCICINPHSGTRTSKHIYDTIVKPFLDLMEVEYTSVFTTEPGHASIIAKQLNLSSVDVLLAISGDGLLFELVNGLLHRPDREAAQQLPLAIVPAGTGNGLALSLGYTGPMDAIQRIVFGSCIPMDVASCLQPNMKEPVYSFLSQTWGTFSDIDIGSERFRWAGVCRFTAAGVMQTLRLPHRSCHIEVTLQDGSLVRFEGNINFLYCSLVSHVASNCRPAPDARLDDGLVHIILGIDLSRLQMARALLAVEDGTHVDEPALRCLRATAFTLTPLEGESCIAIDGEAFDNDTLECSLLPRFMSTVTRS